MKILHVITGLNDGGAEAVLYRMCKFDMDTKHIVISLMDQGKYGPLLKELGIDVYALDLPKGKIKFSAVFRLYQLIKVLKPDVVQTWMYHADLIGGMVARFAGVKNVFWNIRHTTLDPEHSKKSTILVAKICAKLSRVVPKGIVCCADKSVEVHTSIGYNKPKMTVIHNGYDLSSLCELPGAKDKLKDELGEAAFPLIGMVGRFNPQKDHFGLLEAFALVKHSGLAHKLVLVGRDLNSSNSLLLNKIRSLNLLDDVLLLDQRTDIPIIMNMLDLHVLSSSFGEAFPNVLAEAMACGTPCVTTDVGDAAFIVGDTGWVVPPREPRRLAEAILTALKEKNNPEKWRVRQNAVQQRIVNNFSIQNMISEYHKVWY